MQIRHIIFVTIAAWLGACAPGRGMPKPPDSSLSSDQTTTGTQVQVSAPNFESSGWGAQAGAPAVLEALAKCNTSGYFFDRAANSGAGACTTRKSAGKCTNFAEAVSATRMSAEEQTVFQEQLKSVLDGFLFDQCVEDEQAFAIYMLKKNADMSLTVRYKEVLKADP